MISDRLRARALRQRERFNRPRRRWVRFYGAFKNQFGVTRYFEFQVKVSSRLSNKALYKLIVNTANMIKRSFLPLHKRRESFSSFAELYGKRWIRVRKILRYDINVQYPTPFH